MFIAIVEIPGPKRSREQAIAGGKASAPTYAGMKGLISKHYLNGDEGAGGVYIWESREAAEAWYTDAWWPWMEERFGVRPTLKFYDSHLVVDNAAGEVRVDGETIELEDAAAG